MIWECGTHVREKIHTKFSKETQKEIKNLEEIGVYGRMILNKYDGRLWNGFSRLKRGNKKGKDIPVTGRGGP
jgi:hypothetical protein